MTAGHDRVVCRHGTLISTCRCIHAHQRVSFGPCPDRCPFGKPPSGGRVTHMNGALLSNRPGAVIRPTPRFDLTCTLISSIYDDPPIVCAVVELTEHRLRCVGIASGNGRSYDRFSLRIAGATVFGRCELSTEVVLPGMRVEVTIELNETQVIR